MPDQTPRPTLTISVHRTNAERALQLNLSQTDADGSGYGYRLAGPKHYNLGTTELLSSDLNERDAAEIRRMLDGAFPQPTVVYELRTGPDEDARPDVVAQYATALAAMEHGEAQYRAKHGTGDTLEWPSVGTDDAPVWRLEAVDDWDGMETPTDWHIVQVTVPAAYTPAGGESR
jgi:hypothetical protein